MSYHHDNISKALLTLFPDIGLDRSKLPSRQSIVSFPTLYYHFILFQLVFIYFLQLIDLL